jgi:dihydropteridine reductase
MATGRIVVYGGRGALGSAIVSHFKSASWWVANIDLKENEGADANIIVSGDSWAEQETFVKQKVGDILGSDRLDAILCVAGGWAGGSVSSKEFIKNADLMWKQSVWASSIAAAIAAKHLKEGGAIVLPGASPAVCGTPGMVGYGMAKAAVHQLVKSLAEDGSGLPPGCLAAAILPITLDTPMNRKWMSKADQTKWTPLEFVAELMMKWTVGSERPTSGSLVKLVTEDRNTKLVVV